MADKGTGSVASGQLPQSKSFVPGGRQSIGTVGGDDTVGNNVRMAMERSLGVSVGSFVAGQVPDNEALVSGTRQQHIRARKRISVSESCHGDRGWNFGSKTDFSKLVARLVTQPLWPSRVPR